MASATPARVIGFLSFAAFVWNAPIADWLTGNAGLGCVGATQCTIPVAPGLTSPSGVLMVGVALVLRNFVHRFLGLAPSFIAILGGAMVTVVVAPQELIVASAAAFLLSQLANLAAYTALQKQGLLLAVLGASLVGVAVDSVVYLRMALGSEHLLPAALLCKVWGIVICLPVTFLVRRVQPAPLT